MKPDYPLHRREQWPGDHDDTDTVHTAESGPRELAPASTGG